MIEDGRWRFQRLVGSLSQSLSIPLIAIRGEIDDLTIVDRTLQVHKVEFMRPEGDE